MSTKKTIDGLAFKSDKKIKVNTDGTAPEKKTGAQPATTKAKKIVVSDANDFLQPVGILDFDTKDNSLSKSKEVKKKEPAKKTKASVKIDKKLAKKLAKQEKVNAKNFDSAGKVKKCHKVRNIIFTTLLSIVFVILAGGCGLCFWGNDIIVKITGGKGDILDILTFFDEHYEPLKEDSNGRTNILVFGTSGYNMDGDEGSGKHAGAALTDSIMIMSIDQSAGDIALINLPRDLKVGTRCTATAKVNEIYWCNNRNGNNEEAGAVALMNEVGRIFDIEFHYYAHINWMSLIQIVDTLGGITVTLDEDIYDYGWTGAVFDAGIPYTINGEQALGLARARHGTNYGDFSRGNSQQAILVGIRNRIYEKNISFIDLMSLAGTLGDNLRTNLSIEEIKTGIHLTFEFDFDKIRQAPLGYNYLKTANINGISYVIPKAGDENYYALQQYVAEMFTTPVEEALSEEEDTNLDEQSNIEE